jgi:hypothetical protein
VPGSLDRRLPPGSTLVNTNPHSLAWNFHFAFPAANQYILICFDDTSPKPSNSAVEFQFNPLVVVTVPCPPGFRRGNFELCVCLFRP